MDFEESPELTAFREKARAFLETKTRTRTAAQADGGRDPSYDFKYFEQSRAWQRMLYDEGWGGIAWPIEYGGKGLPPNFAGLFAEVQGEFEAHVGAFMVAEGMVGPTIMSHGTDEQKQQHLDPILRGEAIWCQLFSEPEAGSDLAALRTAAVRDGDEWIVNGQKVWTTHAHIADWGILLARTDWDVPKHRGITCFVIDMKTPGIEVRPLPQINGAIDFNEVFFNDVRIPHENMLGEQNNGFGVAISMLTNERAAIGAGKRVGSDEVIEFAQRRGMADDPLVRQDLMRLYTRFQIVRWMLYRIQTSTSHGQMPGREALCTKLLSSINAEHIGNIGMRLMQADSMLVEPDAPDNAYWQHQFLHSWASRIGGGTDQIQRNTIGERGLGLPREPRTDKDIPFRDIPRSGSAS